MSNASQQLLQALPEFYQEQIQASDSEVTVAFIAAVEKAVASMNHHAQQRFKPVNRFADSGISGLEHYMSPPIWTSDNAALLTDLQRMRINRLFAQPTSWQACVRVVESLFVNKSVVLEEGIHVKRYLVGDQISGLGGHSALGANSVLGHKLEDQMNRCRFTVSTLTNEEMDRFGSEAYLALASDVVRTYLRQPLEIELVLVLEPQTKKNVALGIDGQAVLGTKAWFATAGDQQTELRYLL